MTVVGMGHAFCPRMEVLYFLLPLVLLVIAGFVAAFVWAAKTGQFDDLETPAVRLLFDDEEKPQP